MGGICTLDNIVFSKKVKDCNIVDDIKEIEKLDISEFVIVKQYIKDFFFSCDDSCSFYKDAIGEIDKMDKYVEKKYENNTGIIYSINYDEFNLKSSPQILPLNP